jgi:Rv0078B-related antitoxin
MKPGLRGIHIVDDKLAELLRAKTEAERFAMIDRSWRFAHQMIQAMIIHEHPDWSDDQVRQEVARRMSHGAV